MCRLPQPVGRYQLRLYRTHSRSTVKRLTKATCSPARILWLSIFGLGVFGLGIFGLSMFLSMSGCSGAKTKILATINQSASLDGPLPANPLQWKIITSEINKADFTMSTLYGNDIAVGYARANSQHNYPAGSVLSLVTW